MQYSIAPFPLSRYSCGMLRHADRMHFHSVLHYVFPAGNNHTADRRYFGANMRVAALHRADKLMVMQAAKEKRCLNKSKSLVISSCQYLSSYCCLT